MASYEWTPDEGTLIEYRDDGDGFSVSVIVEGEETTETDPDTGEETTTQEPSPNQFEVEGLDDVITFSYDDNEWTIEASKEEAAGIFPVEISYLYSREENVIYTIDKWDDLPDEAEEITKLETTESSPYTTSFDVTASIDGDPDTEETKTYSITIIHVYTANKDKLQEEVDDRR